MASFHLTNKKRKNINVVLHQFLCSHEVSQNFGAKGGI